VRGLFPEGDFLEVFVDVDVETARARDPKRLYARHAAGDIRGLPGLDAPYEPPVAPDLTLGGLSVEDAVEAVTALVEERGRAG
jgi:bifunctional enzyme CysN/CysC